MGKSFNLLPTGAQVERSAISQDFLALSDHAPTLIIVKRVYRRHVALLMLWEILTWAGENLSHPLEKDSV